MKLTMLIPLILWCAPLMAQSEPCAASEFHQLDFWVGDWDVYDVGADQPSAHVTVDRILDGCALHERYSDNEGHRGESFSSYDSGRKQWRQSWYTNRGKSLELLGGQQGDSIVLMATDYDSVPQTIVRGTWKPLAGSVQEKAVISDDQGKTWKPWFDLSFRPAKADTGNEEQAILALDAEYQLAVKRKDVDTLNRLLDEDFVLMGSTGKTYRKADVLAEARDANINYDVQDDSERVVRVFGNTAVITAKLHARGTESGKPFEYFVGFSDTYARGAHGWHYVFGQAGCR